MIALLIVIALTVLIVNDTGNKDDGRYIDNNQSTVAKKADRLPLKVFYKPAPKPLQLLQGPCLAHRQNSIIVWSC